MALDDSPTIEFNIAYHPSPYPHAMREDLREIARVCDGVYIPFTESDLAYAPRKIRNSIDLAHESNLIAVADFWGLGNLFASGGVPSLFTVQHPGHNCVTNRGRAIPMTCPRRQVFRDYARGLIETFAAEFDGDGVLWHEPSWDLPDYLGQLEDGEFACCCDACREAFRERHGQDMPDKATPEVAAFHAEALADLVGELCAYVKGAGEHLITSTCVKPRQSLEFKQAVASVRHLDIFGIGPYWRPSMDVSQKAYIDEHTAAAVVIARANGKLVESWVCACDQTAQHERDPYRAAKLMAAHDIDCLSAWSYRDYQSWAPVGRDNAADPELVWENLRQAYHEIREGDLEIHP